MDVLIPRLRPTFLVLPSLILAAHAQNTTAPMVEVEGGPGWRSAPKERGTLTLVYSCLITIFACTWTVLHLNVPRLGETGNTVFLRKAKWMAITILLPEFIFSKAVCELRQALTDLLEFDEVIRERYAMGLECTEVLQSDWAKMEVTWTWQVKYSRPVRLLYVLMGLRQPIQHSSEEEPVIEAEEVEHVDSRPAGIVGIELNGMSRTSNDSNGSEQRGTQEIRRQDLAVFTHPEQQFWTLMHQYMANMGGIVYATPKEKLEWVVLSGAMLGHSYRWSSRCGHPLQRLVLSREDIADKSKADPFLRLLSVAQISWLVLTVIARRVSALPIAQLELATLAFSVFAIFTYGVNWWKPKDVSRPVRLLASYYSMDDAIKPSVSFVKHLISPATSRGEVHVEGDFRIQNDTVKIEGKFPLIFKLMAVSAFVFGGIHCFAWNFAFPSRAELILWRAASVASAVIPIVPLIVSLVLDRPMAMAEQSMISHLQACISKLGQPDLYKRHLDILNMRWGSNFTREQVVYFFSLPIGNHDFSHEPTKEDLLSLYEFSDWKKCLDHKITSNELTMSLGPFYMFIRLLTPEALNGQSSRVTSNELRYIYKAMKQEHAKELQQFLIDLERSFIKSHKLVPQTEASNTTILDDIMAIATESFEKERKTKNIYERISKAFTIVFGILYVLVRLILLVLLFTPLREAPPDIYTNTPWTRFLPSFS